MAKTRAPAVKTPSFVVDPLYASVGAESTWQIAAGYAFKEPLSIPEPSLDDEKPTTRIPARLKKELPVLLDVTASTGSMFIGPAFLEQITSLQLYTKDRKRRIATFAVATEGALSKTYQSDFRTDVGSVDTTTQHLRVELPQSVYSPLFAKPTTELLVVGLDGQGRTVLLQTLTGRAGESALYVDGAVVSFDIDPKYDNPARTFGWSFDSSLACDEPASKPGPQDAKTRVAVTPRQSRAFAMVLDLSGKMPGSAYSDPPIKAIRSVYVFNEQDELLQTYSAKVDGVYSRGEDKELGSNDTYGYEHLRIGLNAAIAKPLRQDATLSLHVIAVDAQGRTVTTGFPSCPP
jgi:hypothetical protein